ncbi:hypothetical protein AcW1_000123 [Taiwanofungus camphoratus]|nr:hypothetical protein AcW2_001385 [Antrodia cinnamomea]KAI0960885.1 hypothetical protein AcV7_000138 [Antrodia cinnamomea]KAI0962885.1 hypothetical protein AcW1_000123 [Antrodia cinnamomea]
MTTAMPAPAHHSPTPSGSSHAAPEASGSGSRGTDAGELPLKMAMMGLRATPPDMLPPTPPLTLTGHEDREGNGRTESGGEEVRVEEVDITNTRGRWGQGDSRPGTSSSSSASSSKESSSKGVPDADDALSAAFSSQHRPAPQEAQEHPLRLDVSPPSPPLWEQIDPPSNPSRDPYATSQTRTLHEFASSKPMRSRPLIPASSYYFGPPPPDSAYGTPPVGHIGVHHPREIVRVERDYSGGELVQFASVYPLEFEGRITPTQFLETINAINELLLSAHSLRHSFFDNTISFLSLQLSRLVITSHYEKEMQQLHNLIDDLNVRLYNPVGLNILWPRKVAFLFLEIEYY